MEGIRQSYARALQQMSAETLFERVQRASESPQAAVRVTLSFQAMAKAEKALAGMGAVPALDSPASRAVANLLPR